MTSATTADDAPPAALVARPDLAEAALFHASFAIGCVIATVAVLAAFEPPGIGWHAGREAGDGRPVISRAAFEGWAARLLAERSGVHAR